MALVIEPAERRGSGLPLAVCGYPTVPAADFAIRVPRDSAGAAPRPRQPPDGRPSGPADNCELRTDLNHSRTGGQRRLLPVRQRVVPRLPMGEWGMANGRWDQSGSGPNGFGACCRAPCGVRRAGGRGAQAGLPASRTRGRAGAWRGGGPPPPALVDERISSRRSRAASRPAFPDGGWATTNGREWARIRARGRALLAVVGVYLR